MIWLPESPRWLLTRDRFEEGEAVIAALRGLEITDKETQLQKTIIMDSIRASGYAGRKGTPLKAVFTGGKTQHFRRMMLGVSSQFMQQVGGCNAVSPVRKFGFHATLILTRSYITFPFSLNKASVSHITYHFYLEGST